MERVSGGPRDGPDLIACFEGEIVAEIERLLDGLVLAANGQSRKAKNAVCVRAAEHCYLGEEPPSDHDLSN
ncbi:hypothetical protein [Sphingomonas psychrolutea]|uniref:hypothetical protein n=1 Tax=Sphingomonas psychrolutea TaxID=1259676 RepID=UPI00166E1D56|nr:hypothetical protein [Sphingomonas psychrolutea]